jgi:hypothetical protein
LATGLRGSSDGERIDAHLFERSTSIHVRCGDELLFCHLRHKRNGSYADTGAGRRAHPDNSGSDRYAIEHPHYFTDNRSNRRSDADANDDPDHSTDNRSNRRSDADTNDDPGTSGDRALSGVTYLAVSNRSDGDRVRQSNRLLRIVSRDQQQHGDCVRDFQQQRDFYRYRRHIGRHRIDHDKRRSRLLRNCERDDYYHHRRNQVNESA